MNKIYAGLGSTEISENAQLIIQKVSTQLSDEGYKLRSGGSYGAQETFEKHAFFKEIFIPKKSNIRNEAFKLAEGHHPKWNQLSNSSRNFYANIVHILLGKDLDTKVDFVLMWENKENSARIRYVRRLCAGYSIPVYNLADCSVMELLGALGG